MFVVSISYKKPLSEVDQYIPAHKAYLERCYEQGVFLMSGRKEPRTGGVILAQAQDLAALNALLTEDPFYQADVADYEIVEFVPTMTADALSTFKVSA